MPLCSYTVTIVIGNLPESQQQTVIDTLVEWIDAGHIITTTYRGTIEVGGKSKEVVEMACNAALRRIGKRLDDVIIDLFG